MKTIFSGLVALGITAAATSADAQNLNNLNDIGEMATGVYQINDANDNRCYLAVGNYSWGSSGRGYAALSCQDEFDWNAKQSIRKIMDKDIGDMSSGQHSLRIQGQTCTLLIGNYSWGNSGRGYAAMDCVFD